MLLHSMDTRKTSIALCLGASLASVAALLQGAPANAAPSETLSQQVRDAQSAEAKWQFGKAIDIYGLALGAAPSDQSLRQLLKRRALAFEKISLLPKAEVDFTSALAVVPVDPMLYADRGYFYLRHKRYDLATGDFATGARIEPRSPLFRFAMGRVRAAMSDYLGAIECYNDALLLDHKYGPAILSRAEAYVHLNRLEEAKADYDRAVGLDFRREGDRFYSFLGRGYVNIRLEDFTGAIRDLDEALETEPTDMNALLFRGYAYERQGSADLALRDYERAFVANPENSWIRAGLRRLRSN
jgi:tetratricopeptide (TPR) repeat protein